MIDKSYVCDFETSTDENDCRVWAYGIVPLKDTRKFECGNNLDFFMKLLKPGCYYYFHNLKFDGEFILSWLFNHGYKWTNRRNLGDKEFSTLISDMGQFYSIKIHINGGNVEIRDSLKIVTLSVEEIPRAFGFDTEEQKGSIDYHQFREVGHILTEEEKEYIRGDCVIVAKALVFFFAEGFTKMTKGADALSFFKTDICGGEKNFRRLFPEIRPDVDAYLRQAYKGGFVYVNPAVQGREVRDGMVLDVNSLFPSRMHDCEMPYGEPVYFKGKYVPNKLYNTYVQHIRCAFEIKKGKIPTIQIKKSLHFVENEYIETTDFEIVDLYLCKVDMELFLEHYHVYDLEYIDGYKMKSMIIKEFVDYVDYWGERKVKHGKDGNKGMRTIDKSFLNCLYGKFGSKGEGKSKIPYMEEGVIKYKYSDMEERKKVYLPCAIFITAWARKLTIESSQKIRDYSIEKYNKDMYCYSDTDSIHTTLPESDIRQILEIDANELGKWAIEGRFERAKFLRQKCYIEEIEGKLKVTVAGLPAKMHDMVSFDNFVEGAEYFREEKDCTGKQGTKKRFKRVRGGVVLVDTGFSIKAK